MYLKRRSARQRASADRDFDEDLDWDPDSDQGSEWDRYLDWVPGDERAPKFKFPVVAPVIFGLLIGLFIAARFAAPTTFMQEALGGNHHSAPATAPMTSPTFRATVSPTPSTTAAGNAAAEDCTITVPANPLSAQGLATPYQLGGGCSETKTDLQAFVQATILDPATGALAVYNPLVITAGTTPAAAPIVPTLPSDAVVDLQIGFNGNILTQVGTDNSLQQGNCVNGLPGSPFGPVSYCNGAAFFRAADAAIAAGKLKIPAAGTGSDGLACPTSRSFTVVDQDQSANVTALYLLTSRGQTAQKNTANAARLAGATTVDNGSGNALLNFFLDPALRCTPMTAPDLSNPGHMRSSQAMDELVAAAGQTAPIALTPVNDPMALVHGAFSVQKTNLYREGLGQPLLPSNANTTANAEGYCTDLANVQTPRLELDRSFTVGAASPVPSLGDNLFTFMAARLAGSFGDLNCQKYGLTDPVTLTMNANGVATEAALNIVPQSPLGAPAPSGLAPTASSGPASARPSASVPGAPSASASSAQSVSASPAG
jgi:hypothetical protein